MKTSSKKWQKIRKIKGLRQFVTWYPRHVSENPGDMDISMEALKVQIDRTVLLYKNMEENITEAVKEHEKTVKENKQPEHKKQNILER